MTAPIKFELSPQGTSNSLKFAHEHLLNQFFMDQVVTGLIATGYFINRRSLYFGRILKKSVYTKKSAATTKSNSTTSGTLDFVTLSFFYCSNHRRIAY